jgi:hypothetical protein
MQTDLIREPTISANVPWNKGKMIGAKPRAMRDFG